MRTQDHAVYTEGTMRIVGVVVAALFVGCGTPTVTQQPDAAQPGQQIQQSQSPASQPPPAPSVAGIGSPITLQGFEQTLRVRVTVISVAYPATPKNDFGTPQAGNTLAGVQLRLENVGEAAYDDSPSNGAHLIDVGDQQYTASIWDVAEGQPIGPSVTIAPGGTRVGYIAFEVPNGTQLKLFQFALNSGFANQTGEWILTG